MEIVESNAVKQLPLSVYKFSAKELPKHDEEYDGRLAAWLFVNEEREGEEL